MPEEFRNDDNRAFSKTKKRKVVPISESHFSEKWKSPATLFAYICPEDGKIVDLRIFINYFEEGDSLSAEIELDKGDESLRFLRSLHKGLNNLPKIDVKKGDILFVRSRIPPEALAIDVTLSFNLLVQR